MKKVLCILLIIFSIKAVKAETYEVVLTHCVDGDTAFFSVNGNEEEKYRFISIDAPEVLENDDNLGMSSSKYVCQLLKNAKTILIEEDNLAKEDKYGRKLAWVWADKKLIQKEVVENGYAKVAYVYDDYKYSKSLCKIQSDAINNEHGIWKIENEIGYCSTIDVEGVKNNIKYNNIKSSNKIDDKSKKNYKKIKKAEEMIDKVADYSSSNTEKLTIYLLYGIIGLAIIVLIFKSFKDK